MLFYLRFLAIIVAGSFFGCSDYTLTKKIEKSPEINVTPMSHNFGALNSGYESSDQIIEITNIGNDTLSVSDIFLDNGNSNFYISGFSAGDLEPGELIEVSVLYEPRTYETNVEFLNIFSNDEDESHIIIPLDGMGDAPVILVTPEYFDFGIIDIGCEDSVKITIENIGNVNLEIDNIDHYATLPDDFWSSDIGDLQESFPITIEASGYRDVEIVYSPLDKIDDGSYVEIFSNDPTNNHEIVDQVGAADYQSIVSDHFTQDGDATVDILFVVDNSGSMSSNQTNLKNNFDDFIAIFGAAGVDFHIALITTDDAEFVGDVITAADADPVAEFNNQVDLIGYHGSPYEKGLWYGYQATSTGGDAALGSATGFYRDSAKLVVVYVSDEPDFSHSTTGGGGSSTMVPSDYSSHLLSLKSSPGMVVAHAVAGDYPGGCSTNGGAQFGDGYYDVVSDLGGTFMSICADDWSITMETLANESMAMLSFSLSDTPIENTISVEVDGVISTSWSYDSSSNSVTFSSAPPDESEIIITYAPIPTCDEE